MTNDNDPTLDAYLFNTASDNSREAVDPKIVKGLAKILKNKTMEEVADWVTKTGLRLMQDEHDNCPEAKERIKREGPRRMALVYVGKVWGAVEAALLQNKSL